MSKDDGGWVHPNGMELPEGLGITRRDYYAGLAMQGILSNPTYVAHHAANTTFQVDMCYKIADALIAEGNKETP